MLEAFFQTQEVRLPAEIPVQGVTRNRKGRAADVGLGEIGERCLKLFQPLRVAQGDLRPAGPVCQRPRNQT